MKACHGQNCDDLFECMDTTIEINNESWYCQYCKVAPSSSSSSSSSSSKSSSLNDSNNKIINSLKSQLNNISTNLDRNIILNKLIKDDEDLKDSRNDIVKSIFMTNDRFPNSKSINTNDIIVKLRNDNNNNNNNNNNIGNNMNLENLLLSTLSRKRSMLALLLSQSQQAYKRRSIININPRGNDTIIQHINKKSDNLTRFERSSNKTEDTIVRSTIIDGIDNLGSDNYNNHKYCDTSDILASTKLIEYIKSIIMEKIKNNNNNNNVLNSYIINESGYNAISIVIEELVKEMFLSWRNRNSHIPIKINSNDNNEITSITKIQLNGYEKQFNSIHTMNTLLNRIFVLTGIVENKNNIKIIVNND